MSRDMPVYATNLNAGLLGRICSALLALLSTVRVASAQDAQFAFDPNGNLLTRTTAVLSLPVIIGQPQPQIVTPGEIASFFVVVADARGVTYQWRFNGLNMPSATNDAVVITNASAANEGQYSVVLVNSSGSVTSAPAALMLDSDGDGLPNSWELTNFGNLSQTATGDFDGDGVANKDEFWDGTSPTNSSSVLFRLTVLSDGGFVDVSPVRLSYTNGEVVTLTATPFPPEIFHAWTGDLVSHTNSVTLLMNGHKTVFAHFQPILIAWTNTLSGDWSAPANWSPNLVPTALDDVLISNNVTVTVTGTEECNSLTFGIAGTTLSGTGTLIVHGPSSWNAGIMTGGGRTVIETNATLTISNVIVVLNNRTLENRGTVFLKDAGASLSLTTSGNLTNAPGGLVHVQNSQTFTAGSGTRIDNAGVFRKSDSPGTTTVNFPCTFNNYGVVELQSGTLALGGGGFHTGSYEVSAGATLSFSGGIHNSSGTLSITGAGDLVVFSATVTLDGLVNLSGRHTVFSGTANLNGNYICTNNLLAIFSGTANFNGTGPVTPNTLNLFNGSTLAGTANVTVLGEMNWSGGTMSGSGRTIIPSGAALTISNVTGVLLSRTLDNAGTILWNSLSTASIAVVNGVLTNRPGALVHVQSAQPFSAGGISRIDNAGVFRKSNSSGTTFVNFPCSFNNYGLVQAQSGELAMGGGGFHTGSYEVSAGATLSFGLSHNSSSSLSITGAGNLVVFGGGDTITLAGLVNLSGNHTFFGGIANLNGNYICTNNTLSIFGGTVNFNGTGPVTPNILNLGNGTLAGSVNVTVLGTMNWTAGVMSGSGQTIIPSGATMMVSNVTGVVLGRTLDNAGTILWNNLSSATIAVSNGVLTNRPNGLVHVQNSQTFLASGSSRIDNAGVFRKSGNSGTTTVNFPCSFNNYGLVQLQTGTLAPNGGYNSASNALLSCAIGGTNAGTGYARLQVGGGVTLAGGLTVAFTNGFLPALNDSFTVVSAGSRSGAFTSFYYPSNIVIMSLSNTPTAVVLSVTNFTGPPQIAQDLPSSQIFYAGRIATLAATLIGAQPITYQWKKNGVDLVDDSRISGSHTNTLLIANVSSADSGSYQLFATNAQGSAQTIAEAVAIQAVPKLNAGGAGWTLQGTTPPVMNSNNVTLTSGLGSTARSVFYKAPLYLSNFTTSFVYRDVGGGGADGITFCLHNDPRGAAALGGAGNGLGYSGITPSAALAMNIYAPSNVGISLRTNGIIAGANYLPTSPVNIAGGNPIFVSLLYTANVLRATFVESNTANIFTTNFALNVPSIVGAQTAYVGFTGADGGVASTQVVSNFIFVPITGISTELTNPFLLTLSWPASIGGYTMQTRSNLAPGGDIWQSVTNVTTQNGGQNRVTISPLIENRFFRLSINLTE